MTSADGRNNIRDTTRFVARVGGLALGLLLGHGTSFAVQTWLITQGKLPLVASLGLGISVITLLQWLSDWGGIVLLARYATEKQPWHRVWAANIARLIVSGPMILATAGLALLYMPTDQFAAGIMLGGVLMVPIWAMNLTGYLEGLQQSDKSGPLVGLPWLTAGIATMILLHDTENGSLVSGVVIGGSYAFGCALTVILQIRLVRRLIVPTALAPRRADVIAYLSHGGYLISGELPGQVLSRVIIAFLMSAVGQAMTGVYVYIRQIMLATSQLHNILKRVEFPKLAAAVANGMTTFRFIITAQPASFVSMVAVALLGFIISFASNAFPTNFILVAHYAAFFTIIQPLFSIAHSLGQILIIHHQMKTYAVVIATTSVVGTMIVFALTGLWGLPALALADAVTVICQIAFFAAHSAARANAAVLPNRARM